ncbi:MAG: DUF4258 domain-containing protein [Acidobacteriaceae bacterium]
MPSLDWDNRNLAHIAHHRVSPEEVEQVLANGPFEIEVDIRDGELRRVLLGESSTGRILIVVITEVDDKARVVTAWPAKARLRAFWRTQRRGKFHGEEIDFS